MTVAEVLTTVRAAAFSSRRAAIDSTSRLDGAW
jgi:hypothetical protein